jgi:phosphoketolase
LMNRGRAISSRPRVEKSGAIIPIMIAPGFKFRTVVCLLAHQQRSGLCQLLRRVHIYQRP